MPSTPEYDRPRDKSFRHTVSSLSSFVMFAPLNLLNLVAVNGLSVLRPYAPQLIPIVVCLALVPFAVCLSLVAGWMVWKSLVVGWEAPLFFQYGEHILPFARTVIPSIQPSQPYDVSVSLSLPVSESNLLLGNFMTSLTLLTPSNQTLVSVSRPAIMVPPKASWFFRNTNVINLDIALLDSFISRTTNILARVEIGRQDGWKSIGDGRGREVSVIAASLHGRAIPHGVRGLAMRFPLLATIFSASIFLIILSLIVGSCVLPTMFPVPIVQGGNEESDEHLPYQYRPKATKVKSELSSLVSATRARSNSTPLRRRKPRLPKRMGSNPRIVVKPEEVEEEVPVAITRPAQEIAEHKPDVSTHTVGLSSATTRETLRRRTSRKLDSSGENSHSGSEDE